MHSNGSTSRPLGRNQKRYFLKTQEYLSQRSKGAKKINVEQPPAVLLQSRRGRLLHIFKM